MAPGGVYVGRGPGQRYGNPYRVGDADDVTGLAIDRGRAARLYRFFARQTVMWDWRREARRALAGRDLYCWCPVGVPCHADVLLWIANDYDGPDWDGRGWDGPQLRRHDDWRLRQAARSAFVKVLWPGDLSRVLPTMLAVPAGRIA